MSSSLTATYCKVSNSNSAYFKYCIHNMKNKQLIILHTSVTVLAWSKKIVKIYGLNLELESTLLFRLSCLCVPTVFGVHRKKIVTYAFSAPAIISGERREAFARKFPWRGHFSDFWAKSSAWLMQFFQKAPIEKNGKNEPIWGRFKTLFANNLFWQKILIFFSTIALKVHFQSNNWS